MEINRLMEWRRKRLQELRKELTPKGLADVTGIADAYLYQMAVGRGKSYRPVDDDRAALIEKMTGRIGWFAYANEGSPFPLNGGSPSEPARAQNLSEAAKADLQRIGAAAGVARGRLDSLLHSVADTLESLAKTTEKPADWVNPMGPKQLALYTSARLLAGRVPDDTADAISTLILQSANLAAPDKKGRPPATAKQKLRALDRTQSAVSALDRLITALYKSGELPSDAEIRRIVKASG